MKSLILSAFAALGLCLCGCCSKSKSCGTSCSDDKAGCSACCSDKDAGSCCSSDKSAKPAGGSCCSAPAGDPKVEPAPKK